MPDTAIAVSRELPAGLAQGLASLGEVRITAAKPDLMQDCGVYVTTPMDPVPEGLIDQLPGSIALIASIGVGTDHIDLEAATRRGLLVSNTPVVTQDTADLCFALLLATCRRLNYSERRLRAGDWSAGAAVEGMRVHGKTLGIVGFGGIGQALARRARGFDMRVLYHGPGRKVGAEATLGAEYRAGLRELLEEADIVSLNCPLNAATRHLINRQSLSWMKPGSVLINTGRGPLVDEAALIEALHDGSLGAAGLDVFEFEPEVSPGLLELDNVCLLAHIGSASIECRRDMGTRLLRNIQAYFRDGRPLDNCVPVPASAAG
ncbi:2-hydroxyacid dehydrogenase [Kineobactrum salinum]|uniref:D-glycerate dehydrogenase n=1 Tax=Kineobactrum salinum TaxID=2708301 RepID=A0A6C0TXD0_9GAMM|nr:D-glycerate dehydrogenase [Kineobactrum salinum]QIB64436.1 D-glycerate dehydrogenase [Kineobactrum salinum]